MQMKSCTEYHSAFTLHTAVRHIRKTVVLCLALMCIRRFVKPMRWFKAAVFGLFTA